jgi:hypothetical protein
MQLTNLLVKSKRIKTLLPRETSSQHIRSEFLNLSRRDNVNKEADSTGRWSTGWQIRRGSQACAEASGRDNQRISWKGPDSWREKMLTREMHSAVEPRPSRPHLLTCIRGVWCCGHMHCQTSPRRRHKSTPLARPILCSPTQSISNYKIFNFFDTKLTIRLFCRGLNY